MSQDKDIDCLPGCKEGIPMQSIEQRIHVK